ncbi:hypothetical protein JOC86_002373 [Bacillus pakistanensis]|uniref:Phage protein n=1 Tax=Rossellomorea pakistanensis TaxID=992288 RepID=A0ABS2NDA6_9BACI|nr:hypothetical protein [Bacillus pakistanensis]MBM7585831.1 hypothetical protein [Bacillus pakistanensis]
MRDFKEQLKQWKQQHREVKRYGRKKPQKRRDEVLTDADIRSLMGMNKATYRRGKGGAYRQKQ